MRSAVYQNSVTPEAIDKNFVTHTTTTIIIIIIIY